MTEYRRETDSLGEVSVPADRLWGAQTQRSLEYFSIGADLMPREMIRACCPGMLEDNLGRPDDALTMVAVQMMANDVAVGFGGAGGHLEMNVYKPLIIFNLANSITLLTDSCTNFRKYLIEGTKPNLKKIAEYVERSLMLVTALVPLIGYDRASEIAHRAMDRDLTLRAATLELGYGTEAEFDRVVDPARMVHPYVASRP